MVGNANKGSRSDVSEILAPAYPIHTAVGTWRIWTLMAAGWPQRLTSFALHRASTILLPAPSFALLVRRGSDKTNWCVLFNQRDDASGLSYMAIDDLLHTAANAVTSWPEHDLFPEYLSKFIYLPLIAK